MKEKWEPWGPMTGALNYIKVEDPHKQSSP